MQKKKIFIDCRMIGSGGIGSYISALLPLFMQNYECFLLGNKNQLNAYKNLNNVSIFETDIKPFSIKELFCFPSDILKNINSCDVFYTPYCNIPNGIKVPVCSTIHDVVFLDVPNLAGKTGTILRKWFYQRAYNKSKIVFTVSEFSKERIKAHLKTKKVPTIVTYNALPQWFADGVKDVQKDGSILFVGNIKKHKGLHTLLDAFEILLKEDFNAKLKIVGNSENFRTGDTQIAQKIKTLPENSVVFTGRISDEELKKCYAQANLLVQPSLYEGFGMPPLEALCLGTNAVISDIPVFKEIYRDFPVTFFECSNSNDLAQKIKDSYKKNAPSNLPKKYSFEGTFKIIKDSLENLI